MFSVPQEIGRLKEWEERESDDELTGHVLCV